MLDIEPFSTSLSSRSYASGPCKYCGKHLANRYKHHKICKKNPDNRDDVSIVYDRASYFCLACNTRCMSSYSKPHESSCQFISERPKIWWVRYDKKLHGKLKIKIRSRGNSPILAKENLNNVRLQTHPDPQSKIYQEVTEYIDIAGSIGCKINSMGEIPQANILDIVDRLHVEKSKITHQLQIIRQDISIAETNAVEYRRYSIERTQIETNKLSVIDTINTLQLELNRLNSRLNQLDHRMDIVDINIKACRNSTVSLENLRLELSELELLYSKLITVEKRLSTTSIEDVSQDFLSTTLVAIQLDPIKKKKLEALIIEFF